MPPCGPETFLLFFPGYFNLTRVKREAPECIKENESEQSTTYTSAQVTSSCYYLLYSHTKVPVPFILATYASFLKENRRISFQKIDGHNWFLNKLIFERKKENLSRVPQPSPTVSRNYHQLSPGTAPTVSGGFFQETPMHTYPNIYLRQFLLCVCECVCVHMHACVYVCVCTHASTYISGLCLCGE